MCIYLCLLGHSYDSVLLGGWLGSGDLERETTNPRTMNMIVYPVHCLADHSDEDELLVSHGSHLLPLGVASPQLQGEEGGDTAPGQSQSSSIVLASFLVLCPLSFLACSRKKGGGGEGLGMKLVLCIVSQTTLASL